MKARKSLEIKSAITALTALDDGSVILMDQNGSLRCIDIHTYKTLYGFKTNIKQERSSGQHMSVNASGEHAACLIPHSAKASVYRVKDKKLMYTIEDSKSELEAVCVDDNNHYLVTGGTDGRTHVYNLKTSGLVYTFPPRADYISSLAISDSWILSASYDKSIAVLNLSTMQTPIRLNAHNSAVIEMRILKNMRMLSMDKTGNIILWDLKTGRLIERFSKVNDDVTCFCLSKDERFLFVATKLGYISLYVLESAKLLKHSFLKESSKICSLSVLDDENTLVVGTKSGEVNFYPLVPDESYLLQQLKNREYPSLYKEAEENPLLCYSSVYLQLEAIWKNTFIKAGELLEKEQKNSAEVLLEPFKGVKSKSLLIQNLFLDYKEYNKFKAYVSKKQYSLAYPMSIRHPHFQETSVYMKMEKQWRIQFNKAKNHITSKEGDEKVKVLLADFKGISTKTILIQELLKQRKAYLLFQKKLTQKDYLAVFSLLDKYPFIKEFDEYDRLIDYADATYIKAQKALDNKDYENVLVYTKQLLYVPGLNEDAKEMMENAEVMRKFSLAFDENNISMMYTLIGEHPFLMEYTEAKKLEENWRNHLELAQRYASKADIVNVIANLEGFFDIKAKFFNIALIIKQSYIVQINKAISIKKDKIKIENAIKQYLLFFAEDEEIKNLLENFKRESDSKISIDKLSKGDIHLFRPSMIVPSIVV